MENIKQDHLGARTKGGGRRHGTQRSLRTVGRNRESKGRRGEKTVNFLQPRQGQNRREAKAYYTAIVQRQGEEPLIPQHEDRERDDL